MITERPCILYTLPQTRPTQAITGRNPLKSMLGIKDFISRQTSSTFEQPDSIEIVIHSPWDDSEDSMFIDRLVMQVESIFGGLKREPAAIHYPSGVPRSQQKYTWKLEGSDLQMALRLISEGHPWPKYNIGPIELITSYDYQMVNHLSKDRKESFNMRSSLLVWYSSSCCCSPTIYFPFETPDDEFTSYFRKVATEVPFKMEEKYLRLVRPDKSRTRHIFSKVSLAE